MEQPTRSTRYFVIKCNTFQSLGISFDHSVWAVPVHATKRLGDVLNAAFAAGRVLLIASVNGSKAWQGVAEMTTPVSDQPKLLTFAGDGADGATIENPKMREGFPFQVKWLYRFQRMYINMVQFSQCADMKNELDNGRLVNFSRNLQEIDNKSGDRLCALFMEGLRQEEENLKQSVQPEQHFFRSDTEEVSEATWAAFFTEVSRVGRVLYAGHVGSRCYNLHVESSDLDMLVIVAAPTGVLLSLHPPKDTHKNRAGFKPDFTLHEASAFVEMLAGGDTRMLESLYTDKRAVVAQSEEWEQLRAIRASFITKEAVRKYVSEVHAQKGIKKLQQLLESHEMERARKHMYILTRLARLALQLLREEQLTLWHEGEARQHYLDIRSGKCSIETARAEFDELLKEIEERLVSSDLPEKLASTDMLNDWLLRLRAKELSIPKPPVDMLAIVKSAPEPLLKSITNSLPHSDSHLLFVGSKMIIFAAPTCTLFGFHPLPPGTDKSHYELSRFCNLIERGNPYAVQALFVDDAAAEFISSAWLPLRQQRESFITQKVIAALVGLVKRQEADGSAGCSVLLNHVWKLVLGGTTTTTTTMLRDADMLKSLENANLTSFAAQYTATTLDWWHTQVRLATFSL